MKYYLSIDLGASSARHIIGYIKNGELKLDEVYRFSDYLINDNGSLVWDIEKIFLETEIGIKKAIEKYHNIESMAIDSWGCDYVLLNGDKEILPCYSYRDKRTKNVIDEVHSLISFDELYKITGSQFQPFNTIYQLYSDKKEKRLDQATSFLMIPEYLVYKLTGKIVKEYTNASTTGLMDLSSFSFSKEIISKLGLKESLFLSLHKSGEVVSGFREDVAKVVGGNIKVRLCSSHDTASAVKGIDIGMDVPYLSSGTWSLLGIKTDSAIRSMEAKNSNYSNELGDNYIRFQKNIMGMWIVNNLASELNYSISDMIKIAKRSKFKELYDVNDARFLAPVNFLDAINSYLVEKGKEKAKVDADFISSTFHSLAYSYKCAYLELEKITKKRYDKLYIIGGGAKNTYLNDLTSEYLGRVVIALPIEATAIGNLKSQMEDYNEKRNS